MGPILNQLELLNKIPLSRLNIIAIDGPVATGKSVVGRLLAKRLGYRFLDSGAMYRAITWLAIDQGINVEDHDSVSMLSSSSTIELGQREGEVFINGHLVPLEGKRIEIDKKVSLIARLPKVREILVEQQQHLAEGGNIVIVGRDIGTVVVPNAAVKLYFHASTLERSKRRYQELLSRGHDVELDQVLDEIVTRDKLDSERVYSPLQPATDAHIIDTEGLDIKEVVENILKLIEVR